GAGATDEHLQRSRAAQRMQRERLIVVAGLQVGDELGRADQVGDALTPVALGIEAEVLGGAAVAPLDLVGAIEQEDAVRRRLHRRDELRQPRPFGLRRALEGAQAALDAVAALTPK